MKIEIVKLSPELVEDYVSFFDTTPHDDHADENKCYCVCWCSADHRVKMDFSSPEKRRELAVQYVNDGIIQGYLAYYEGQVVGWCNANIKSECLHCISWLRIMKSVESNSVDKVKSVFCYVIAPAMQRKGIATSLMERVCKDAADDGYDYVEVYPRKEFVSAALDFTGPVEMYKRLGFVFHAEIENNRFIMRKQLKY